MTTCRRAPTRCTAPGSPAGRWAAPPWACTTSSAHVLGGTFRLPHAGVHSALLPQVAAFNAPAAPAAFTLAADALGVAGPDRVGPALFDLATRLAAPTSLAGLGLDPGAIEQVAATVAASPVVNPRPVTEADLVRLLRDAHAGKRP